jgi:NAD(P)-dependent dehydrogenase (short-subunit alcohol dehydrogenase family)
LLARVILIFLPERTVMVPKIFSLQGRTAVVTGGSKGLGIALARGLAEAGASVAIVARHREELDKAVTEIKQHASVRVESFVSDLSHRASVTDLATEILDRFGQVDILVNNAGINIVQPIESVVDDDWDRVLAINLHAPMSLARAFVPGMKAQGWGRIVQISSVFGRVSRADRNAYSASKAALLGLTRSMALELAPFGVTVNSILPGPFATPMTSTMHPDPEKRRWFTDRVPIGRWGRPEELVGPLLLLASDAGSFITGTDLAVDGGWLAQ